MNKKIVLFASLICLLFAGGAVFAQGIVNPLSYNDFGALLLGIISSLTDLVTKLAALMVLISGIMFLVSAGQPGMIQKAKTALFFAIVGIALGIGAGILTDTVKLVTNSGAETDVLTIVSNMALKIGTLMTGLATAMLIVSGIFFLLSFGNPARMEMAKKALFYSILGIIIGLGAQVIVDTVMSWVK